MMLKDLLWWTTEMGILDGLDLTFLWRMPDEHQRSIFLPEQEAELTS
jgi:hypothetical protein